MQIFVLEPTVHAAARSLCDKHVVNQILETAELLALAHVRHGEPLPPFVKMKPRSLRHKNHPCAIWVAKSGATYKWAHRYAVALCIEYTVRYKKTHAYEQDITDRLLFPPFPILFDTTWTPWPQVIPKELRQHDPVAAYRDYYHVKSHQMKMRWSKRDAPEWYMPPYSRVPALGRAYS